MSDLVNPSDIERIVGVKRGRSLHCGRAVSDEQMVYILHSRMCVDTGTDLRNCRFSIALDRGINERAWAGHEDRPVMLGIRNGLLIPIADLDEGSRDE